jgi:aerobic-type carbon monoxide dehydrogenase small subunit (CoxS/CutS family)
VDRNPKAGEADIRKALSGVICRCGANIRMLKAIMRYVQGVKA